MKNIIGGLFLQKESYCYPRPKYIDDLDTLWNGEYVMRDIPSKRIMEMNTYSDEQIILGSSEETDEM